MMRHTIWPFVVLLLITTVIVRSQCLPSTAERCSDPFSPAFFQQLQLTPQQAAVACTIAQHVREGLRVPVYHGDQLNPYSCGDGLEVYVQPITWTTVDCAIACDQQCLQQQLAACHPNPVAVTWFGQDIARLQLIRAQVINAGLRQLACILSPEQCAMLPAISDN